MREAWNDWKVAVRLLARQPLHSAAILLSVALGVGLNTAAFGFFDLLFLAPVPGVAQPGRVATLAGRGAGAADWMPLSYPDSRDLAASVHALSGLAPMLDLRVGLGDSDESVLAEAVGGSFFTVLGVRADLGRVLAPADEAASDPHVAVLSHRLWQERFAGDRRLLGGRILINHHPFTVVGVAARDFRGVDVLRSPLLWVPLTAARDALPDPSVMERRDMRGFYLVARLAPGASWHAAEAEASAVEARLSRAYAPDGPSSVAAAPLATRVQSPRGVPLRRAAALVLLATAVFLGIACCNVIHLLLVRALARRREILTRLALGVSRERLLRQFLAEGLLLAFLGGAAALAVAAAVQKLFVLLKPPFLAGLAAEPLVSGRGAAFALLLILALTLLFSFTPLLLAYRRGGYRQLGGPGESGGAASGRFGGGLLLLAAQACLSTTAVACAAFFLASLLRLVGLDPGFERRNLLLAPIDLHAAGYAEERGRLVERELLTALSGEPAIAVAALSENRPLGGYGMWHNLALSAGGGDAAERLAAASETVSRDYFRTVGVAILQGRAFDRGDVQRAPAAAVVDETLARRLWPGRRALGERFYVDGEAAPVTVVGVAGDTRSMSIGAPPVPVVYFAAEQRYLARFFIDVRPARSLATARVVLASHLGRLTAARRGPVLPITEVIADSLWLPRMCAVLLSLLGASALLIAAVGMAGVALYISRRRSRDLAIRAALGALRRQTLAAGAARELAAAAAGIAAGAALALLAHRWAAALLFESGRDLAATVAVASLSTLAAALPAIIVPVAAIASAEPVRWLRS